MFLKIQSIADRHRLGSSCFIEIQYCKLPIGTAAEKIVSVSSIKHWDLTSLYIYDDDMPAFYSAYKGFLKNGLYSNMNEGAIDSWGINYYSEEKSRALIENLKINKPKGYEIFLQWLTDNPYTNGFYILGV